MFLAQRQYFAALKPVRATRISNPLRIAIHILNTGNFSRFDRDIKLINRRVTKP